jgi:D-sedoheptulose 7-phosphate isomerase
MQDLIRKSIEDSMACQRQVMNTLGGSIEEAAWCIVRSINNGGQLLLFGNGGSAADAQHIAGELVGRFLMERKGAPAVALTTDTSVMTSVANDYGFKYIFARQIEAVGRSGDVALAISTSGKSDNLMEGIRQAKMQHIKVIGLLGRDGGPAADEVDLALVVPGQTSPRIQESHILIGHILCHIVEQLLFGSMEK